MKAGPGEGKAVHPAKGLRLHPPLGLIFLLPPRACGLSSLLPHKAGAGVAPVHRPPRGYTQHTPSLCVPTLTPLKRTTLLTANAGTSNAQHSVYMLQEWISRMPESRTRRRIGLIKESACYLHSVPSPRIFLNKTTPRSKAIC